MGHPKDAEHELRHSNCTGMNCDKYHTSGNTGDFSLN